MSYTRWRSQFVLDELNRYNGGFALEALIGTCFPGCEVPPWFSHRASGSVLETKIFPHRSVNRFTGIALCAVIVFHGCHDQRKRVLVKCNCELKNKDGLSIQFTCTVGGWNEPSNAPQNNESNHVFIGYTSNLDIDKHGQEKNKEVCSHTESSFEFQVTDGTEVLQDVQVVKCGFRLLYATEDLRVEPGVNGASIKEHQRNYLKNVVISNVRGDTEIAERSSDGECEITELLNNMIAQGNASTPQPAIPKSPAPRPEYGTGSDNLERESHTGASNVDTLSSSWEPRHRNVNLIPVVASSSQDGLQQTHPRVFVSFHGSKLYKTFVRNLVSTLRDEGLNVFTGNHNGKEKRLQQLYKRIKKSKIVLVIFSKTYLDSNFCLNELVMVNKFAKEGKLLVIPVFYDVSIMDVKYLKGEFGRCFKKLRARYTNNPEKVLKLETSVKSIVEIMGIRSEGHGKDARLIEAIVKAVQKGLTEISGGNRTEGYMAIVLVLYGAFLLYLVQSFPELKFLWLVGFVVCNACGVFVLNNKNT